MDAAAPSAEIALAALSSRKCSFRACLEAFRFLIKALEKGDIVSGGRLEREVRNPIAMLCGLLSPMILMKRRKYDDWRGMFVWAEKVIPRFLNLFLCRDCHDSMGHRN